MKENRKIEPEKIHLLKIQTVKGSIDFPSNSISQNDGKYSFSFEIEHGIEVKEKIIGIKLKVDIAAKEAPTTVIASFTHELIFEVENLDEFIDIVEGRDQPIIDRFMMGTLIGIAYSTVRGIIFGRIQGTPLNGVILPVIDPKKLIAEDKPVINENKPI